MIFWTPLFCSLPCFHLDLFFPLALLLMPCSIWMMLPAVSPKCRTFWKGTLFYWIGVWAQTTSTPSGLSARTLTSRLVLEQPGSPTTGCSSQNDSLYYHRESISSSSSLSLSPFSGPDLPNLAYRD